MAITPIIPEWRIEFLPSLDGSLSRSRYTVGIFTTVTALRCNMRAITLAYGHYKVKHRGRVPAKLEDFMSSSEISQLIFVDGAEIKYFTDSSGCTWLSYKLSSELEMLYNRLDAVACRFPNSKSYFTLSESLTILLNHPQDIQ